MNYFLRLLKCALVVCWIQLAALNAIAQNTNFPNKPIHLIVTYPPGGSSDLLARIVGKKMGEFWNQTVIVENKTGAAGSIGMEYIAHQAPDGYSYVIANMGPAVVNPLLSKLNYNMDKDFIAVSLICTGPNVLVVPSSSPFKSVDDIVNAARNKPDEVNFATSGSGSMSHLSTEMMIRQTHLKLTHVPYKGGVLAVNDVLAGHIHFIISDALPVMQFVKDNQLRALAVTSATRSAFFPNVPTFAETGMPGIVALNWWGVYLPANTPKSVVEKYHTALAKVMADPETKSQFASLGVDATYTTQTEFQSFIQNEQNNYAKLIKDNNIHTVE